MIHAIIIEDEKPAARRLEKMLQKAHIHIDAMLSSVEESIDYLTTRPEPDMIFLDIQLSDGISFDIFESVQPRCPIVFTTAYDQYAIQAFKHNSIDYLLKPFTQEALQQALDKYHKSRSLIDYEKLLQSLQTPKYKERFICKYGQHIKRIGTDQIAYFVSRHKTTWLVSQSGDRYIYESSLDELATQLNPKDFQRVNRSFIVSYHSIKDIIAYSNSRLKLVLVPDCEEPVIVARERVKSFKAWLEI